MVGIEWFDVGVYFFDLSVYDGWVVVWVMRKVVSVVSIVMRFVGEFLVKDGGGVFVVKDYFFDVVFVGVFDFGNCVELFIVSYFIIMWEEG